jgi:hypothetical protein
MKNARRALRAAALAACTLLGPGVLAKPVNAPQKPTNMIFVLVDDLRYDAMGFLTPGLQTPNIDALAKNGVLALLAQPRDDPDRPDRAQPWRGRQ